MANRDLLLEEFERYLEEIDDPNREEKEEKACECGSKHTSRPNYHLSWCPLFTSNE